MSNPRRLNAADFATTTLAASATSTDTTLTVSSSTGFPATPFRCTLSAGGGTTTPTTQKEIVEVTNVTGASWTVIRAVEGPAASAWQVNDVATNEFTAGTLAETLDTTSGVSNLGGTPGILSDLFANLSPSVAGRLAVATDTAQGPTLYRDTGTALEGIVDSRTAGQFAQLLGLPADPVRDYGASGSALATTGTIAAGSNQLTVALYSDTFTGDDTTTTFTTTYKPNGPVTNAVNGTSASATYFTNPNGTVTATFATAPALTATVDLNYLDFQNGQALSIANVGPLPTNSAPTSVSVSTGGTNGTATFSYAVASLDGKGGVTAATTGSYSSCNAVLGDASFNILSIAGATGATIAIYRASNSAGYANGLISVCSAAVATFWDEGQPVIAAPPGIPTTAPAAALGDLLATTIASGAGTTTLTLAAAATTAVAGAYVQHDDTVALQNCLANNVDVEIPAATLNISKSISGIANQRIRGSRLGKIKMTQGFTSGDAYGLNLGAATAEVNGITLDGSNMTTAGGPVIAIAAADVVIANCEIDMLVVGVVLANACSRFHIEKNLIKMASPNSSNNQAINLYTSNHSGGMIRGNICINAGLDISGNGIEISDNDISGWGYGSGITINGDAYTYSLRIIGNHIHDQSPYSTHDWGIENWAPRSVITGNKVVNTQGTGIGNSADGTTIVGNQVENVNASGIAAGVSGSGIALRDGGAGGYNGNYCTVSGNSVVDTRTTPLTLYGFFTDSTVTYCSITGNQFKDGNVTSMSALPASFQSSGNIV